MERLVHQPLRGPQARDRSWLQHPRLIEDDYTITDAIVVGTLLNSLLRHGDRVMVACQAQLINVIGFLHSEPDGAACKQTIAYPFEQMRRMARGQIVHLITDSDRYDSANYTDVPLVDPSATYDAENQQSGTLRRQPQPQRARRAFGRPPWRPSDPRTSIQHLACTTRPGAPHQ